MDFLYIGGQKEAIWNTLCRIFARRRGPKRRGAQEYLSPLFLPSRRACHEYRHKPYIPRNHRLWATTTCLPLTVWASPSILKQSCLKTIASPVETLPRHLVCRDRINFYHYLHHHLTPNAPSLKTIFCITTVLETMHHSNTTKSYIDNAIFS